jgi:hypothetical protein
VRVAEVGSVVAEEELDKPRRIAQVDKRELSEITTAVDPPCEFHVPTDIGC